MRNTIIGTYLIKLFTKPKSYNDDEGDRNLTLFYCNYAGQYDKHKYDTAGTTQSVLHEQSVNKCCDDRCDNDHEKDRFASVFFFKDRSQKKEEQHIVVKMFPICMP